MLRWVPNSMGHAAESHRTLTKGEDVRDTGFQAASQSKLGRHGYVNGHGVLDGAGLAGNYHLIRPGSRRT